MDAITLLMWMICREYEKATITDPLIVSPLMVVDEIFSPTLSQEEPTLETSKLTILMLESLMDTPMELIQRKSPKELNIREVYKATPQERTTNAILLVWMRMEE